MKTRSGLTLGISLPQSFANESIDYAYLRDYLRAVESIGFEDGWLTEGILTSSFHLEPVTYLSYVAAMTQNLRLGVAVIILNTRNPVQLAKALATVDQLSGGRMILGVGLGGGTRNYAAFGISAEKRVSRFEEAVNVMKALWTQETVNHPGALWKLENARMKPKCFQKPHLPIYFGGHAEPAMQRAVRMGDGWMAAGSTSTEQSLKDLGRIREILKEQGRDEKTFWLSKRLYLAIDDNESLARKKLTEALNYHYGTDMSDVGLAATPSRAVEVLGQIREAGARHILVNPCYDHLRQMELLATKIIPQL